MRLITHFEMATKSINELHGMLGACYIALAMSDKTAPNAATLWLLLKIFNKN